MHTTYTCSLNPVFSRKSIAVIESYFFVSIDIEKIRVGNSSSSWCVAVERVEVNLQMLALEFHTRVIEKVCLILILCRMIYLLVSDFDQKFHQNHFRIYIWWDYLTNSGGSKLFRYRQKLNDDNQFSKKTLQLQIICLNSLSFKEVSAYSIRKVSFFLNR